MDLKKGCFFKWPFFMMSRNCLSLNFIHLLVKTTYLTTLTKRLKEQKK